MDESTAWLIVFANLVAMQLHPGQNRDGPAPSYTELAMLADKAVRIWKERYP